MLYNYLCENQVPIGYVPFECDDPLADTVDTRDPLFLAMTQQPYDLAKFQRLLGALPPLAVQFYQGRRGYSLLYHGVIEANKTLQESKLKRAYWLTVIQLLLQKGADPAVRCEFTTGLRNSCPLDYACVHSDKEVRNLLLHNSTARLLAVQNSDGFTPMLFTIQAGNYKEFQFLHQLGSTLDLTNTAVCHSLARALRALLDQDAQSTHLNPIPTTFLQIVVYILKSVAKANVPMDYMLLRRNVFHHVAAAGQF